MIIKQNAKQNERRQKEKSNDVQMVDVCSPAVKQFHPNQEQIKQMEAKRNADTRLDNDLRNASMSDLYISDEEEYQVEY